MPTAAPVPLPTPANLDGSADADGRETCCNGRGQCEASNVFWVLESEVGEYADAQDQVDGGTWCSMCGYTADAQCECDKGSNYYDIGCDDYQAIDISISVALVAFVVSIAGSYLILSRGRLARASVWVMQRVRRGVIEMRAWRIEVLFPEQAVPGWVIVCGAHIIREDGVDRAVTDDDRRAWGAQYGVDFVELFPSEGRTGMVIADGVYPPDLNLAHAQIVEVTPKRGRFLRWPVGWLNADDLADDVINDSDLRAQVAGMRKALPFETPSNEIPFSVSLAPDRDTALMITAKSLVIRFFFGVLYMAWKIIFAIVKTGSTILLILISVQSFGIDVKVRFAAVFNALEEALARVLYGVCNLGKYFAWVEAFFRALLFTINFPEWILKILRIADVTCDGSHQPWYLIANIIIVSIITLVAASHLPDMLRFSLVWRSFVVDRRRGDWRCRATYKQWILPEINEFWYGRLEEVMLFGLRTLCTNMSFRPLDWTNYNDNCVDPGYGTNQGFHWDRAIAIAVAFLSWGVFPCFILLVMNAFVNSIGPAPPIDPQLIRRALDRGDEPAGADDAPAGRFDRNAHEQTRQLWPDLFGEPADEAGRIQRHHQLFSKDGVLRTTCRHGGYAHVLRVLIWKIWQLAKVAVGKWDREVLLATRVLPRAEALLPHDLTLPEARQPKGLQLHQDFISISGRMVASMFCLFPGGAILTKISEAFNRRPIFVTPAAVDKDAKAVWMPTTRWWQLLPDLYPLHPMNQALIVLNSQIGLRMLSFVLELVSVILIVTLVLLPTREDSSDSTDGYRWSGCSSPNKNGTSAPTMLPTPGPALTLSPTFADAEGSGGRFDFLDDYRIYVAYALLAWLVLQIFIDVALFHEELECFLRIYEWERRYTEIMLGGHRGTRLLDHNGAKIVFSAFKINNAPLPHEHFGGVRTDNQVVLDAATAAACRGAAAPATQVHGLMELFAAAEVRGHFVLTFAGQGAPHAEIARIAHDSGAEALIIANNDGSAPDDVLRLIGDDKAEVRIPCLSVSYNSGRNLALAAELGQPFSDVAVDEGELDEGRLAAFAEIKQAIGKLCSCRRQDEARALYRNREAEPPQADPPAGQGLSPQVTPVLLEIELSGGSEPHLADPSELPAAAEPSLEHEPEQESWRESKPEPVAAEPQPWPGNEPGPTHRVLFPYTAEQSWQLSVEPGQEVMLVRSVSGWSQVRLLSDPTKMGGVPEGYLEPLAPAVDIGGQADVQGVQTIAVDIGGQEDVQGVQATSNPQDGVHDETLTQLWDAATRDADAVAVDLDAVNVDLIEM